MPNAMQRGAVNEADTIVYPPGCRDVTQDLGSDELIRRLKTLAHTFQSMGQDDGTFQEYIPLSLHLSDNYFLSHASKDVQLLIACCIADVLRVYAPEAPYKEPDKVKRIFMFLIRQLSGLRDPKDPAFKRYFYLLENLAYVKSFNMCFELEDSQEIFCSLFSLMFKIVNDEHSQRVRSFMLDVMCPLITESDVVSTQLLDIILINLVDPTRKTRKQAYKLAEHLVLKTADTLEPYIQNFFNQALILGNEEKRLNISKKVYDLIDELNKICPNVLLAVLPQLEFKLKSTEASERMGVVTLLAGMFSEEGSNLALHHRNLWLAFLGRFNDISVQIRTTCVQHSMHFLLNHPELRSEIVQTLKLRQHDSEETVRLEVVKAIVSTAKKNFSIVADSEELLNFVKERTLDKKYKIRREAMTGLAFIYKEHQNDPDVPDAIKNAVTWIKDKILHGYYMPGLDDRLLVERLMNMYLVPYKLPPQERMKKLYYIFATIDENATKAFIELQKHQMTVRKSVTELLETYSKQLPHEERDKELVARVTFLSKFLPESVKSLEFLKKFALQLASDQKVLQLMKNVVDPKVSCKECTEAVNQLLKKAGPPVKTNLYYSTVKMLMERVSSVMVDREALQILVHYVVSCVKGDSGPNIAYEIGIDPASAGEKGLRLLYVLSFVFPSHFLHDDILSQLISLLQLPEDSVQPLVLSILTFVGKHCPIGDVVPNIMDHLIPLCKRFAETGTAKQAKHAIRCLCSNVVKEVDQDKIYPSILENLKESLSLSNIYFRTALVSLGHIAYQHPEKFPVQMKNIVSRKVVKELLMKDQTTTTLSDSEDWVEEDELPEETRCKIEGMKLMARWLLGLKNDNISAQKTFRMLSAFILHKGDLLEEGKVSKSEKAWLRLCAGTCMLKICEQKGVGDQFTAEQFYTLSSLMMDESGYVRERFATKLHKGLSRGIPHRCLPLDFMGLYALGGHEPDRARRAAIKSYMMGDISKRREYVRGLLLPGASEKASEQLPHILPDYMLVFAVPVLAHDPEFTSYENVDYLTKIRSCLWFILEPLITKNESYCFAFYKELVEKMKQHKDAVSPEDDAINYKIWAVCDLAMGLILQKTVKFDMKDSGSSARIPPMYFRKADGPDWSNARSYLPPHLQYQIPKKSFSGTQPQARLKPNQAAVENLERAPTRVPREETDEDDDEEPSRKRSRLNDGTANNAPSKKTKKQTSGSSEPNSQAKENMPPKKGKKRKASEEEIKTPVVKNLTKKGSANNLITNYLSPIPKENDSPKSPKRKSADNAGDQPTKAKTQRRPTRGKGKEPAAQATSTPKHPRKRKAAELPEKSTEESTPAPRKLRKTKQSPAKDKESLAATPKRARKEESDANSSTPSKSKGNNKKDKGKSPPKSKTANEASQPQESSVDTGKGSKKKMTKKAVDSSDSKEPSPRKVRGSRKKVSDNSEEVSAEKPSKGKSTAQDDASSESSKVESKASDSPQNSSSVEADSSPTETNASNRGSKKKMTKKAADSSDSKEPSPRKVRGSRKKVSDNSEEVSAEKPSKGKSTAQDDASSESSKVESKASDSPQNSSSVEADSSPTETNASNKGSKKKMTKKAADSSDSKEPSPRKVRGSRKKVSDNSEEVSAEKPSKGKSTAQDDASSESSKVEWKASDSTQNSSSVEADSSPTETNASNKDISSSESDSISNPTKKAGRKNPKTTLDSSIGTKDSGSVKKLAGRKGSGAKGRVRKSAEAAAILKLTKKKDSPVNTKVSVNSKNSTKVKSDAEGAKEDDVTTKPKDSPENKKLKKPILRTTLKTKAKNPKENTKRNTPSKGNPSKATATTSSVKEKATPKKVAKKAAKSPAKKKPTPKKATKQATSYKVDAKKQPKASSTPNRAQKGPLKKQKQAAAKKKQ